MVTKAQLTERKRGKGGSIVRVRGKAGEFVVKWLWVRRGVDERPDTIAVGRVNDGLALSVPLADVELV